LGHLIRGVPPASLQKADSNMTASPPQVHVVLSLREDFLGILEEGAEHIPQILDHRFRLTPLTCETAAQAITCPTSIDDPGLSTKPFRLDPELVAVILNYLAKTAPGARGSNARTLEPFHLQLICQRVEKVVAVKQKLTNNEVVVTFKDFGGQPALAQTLASFYEEAVQSLTEKHLRPAVRRMCEEYLISPEGRRLSVEARELQRQLKLPHGTLSRLVEARLLRTDRRSDTTYYELSHDALVEPVLSRRRTQAVMAGWAALSAGSVISIVSGGCILVGIFYAVAAALKPVANTKAVDGFSGLLLLLVIFLPTGFLGITWVRTGQRRRARYRRHTPHEFTERLPTLLPLKDRFFAWTLVVAGSILLTLFGLASLVTAIVFLLRILGRNPTGFASLWQDIQTRPVIETLWLMLELWGPILLGWIIYRFGLRRLGSDLFQSRFIAPTPGVDGVRSLLPIVLRIVLGTCALVLTVVCTVAFWRCAHVAGEIAPSWFPQKIKVLCHALYKTGWKSMGPQGGLFIFAQLAISIAVLPGAVRDVWNLRRYRQLARSTKPTA
jgi:hypothetical protein